MNPSPNLLPQLTRLRIQGAVDRLKEMLYSAQTPLDVQAAQTITPIGGPVQAAACTFAPVAIGASFGAAHDDWRTQWFRLRIPDAAAHERGQRHLLWRCQGESTVHIDGTAWAGLDCAHPSCMLPDQACELLIETCLWQTAIWADPPPITTTGCRFDGAVLAVRNPHVHACWIELRVLLELVDALNSNARQGHFAQAGTHHYCPSIVSAPPLLRRLLHEVNEALDVLDTQGPAACDAQLRRLRATLPADPLAGQAALVGHAHMDLVWLWPESATRRKNAHTCATMAGLMDRYPEMTFMNSQPWLLNRLAEDDPALRQRVQKHIDEGRWIVDGMFEVESDVLLSGGETLVRCLALGQKHIQAITGRLGRIVWIPDVFGYSGCLPQLIRLAGGDSFFTSKLTWNRVTRFPYTSFVWEGNDGSAVLAHLPPNSFAGNVDVADLRDALDRHRQCGVHDTLLCPTGYGDGGGGPTEDQAERGRRVGNLAGVPRTHWASPRDFFADLHRHRESLPRYRGELYLQVHRGTTTSQSEHKRLFRAAESALQVLEAAHCATGAGPLSDKAWERVIFTTFHDAIPGSSIPDVYATLNPQLQAVSQEAQTALHHVLGTGDGAIRFNPLSVARRMTLPDHTGRLQSVQLPALSAVKLADAIVDCEPVTWKQNVLGSAMTQATFSEDGQLIGLCFGGKPLPLNGPVTFMLHPDNPSTFDAWEIDAESLPLGDALQVGKLNVVTSDPQRIELEQTLHLPQGEAVVIWSMDATSPGLQVALRVNWQVPHRLLRVVIPTRLQGRMARFGGPFGAALRCQLPGDEQDEARWEGAGSRWAAVTDDLGQQGVALISQAKYGFSAYDGQLGMSLLRAPTFPDSTCDIGAHTIHFQIRAWRSHSTVEEPATALAAECAYTPAPAVGRCVQGPATWTQLETLVPSWAAPQADGAILLRAHECAGCAGRARLQLARGFGPPQSVDFLGRPLEDVTITATDQAGVYDIAYRPYQIVSILSARK